MLKDILSWLCGKDINPQPEITKDTTELSINRRRYKRRWKGEEETTDIAQSYAISDKPDERFLLVELSGNDMKRALYFQATEGDINAKEKKALIKEIASDLKPGTEIVLYAKEDLDLFINLGFALTNFESFPILKLREK